MSALAVVARSPQERLERAEYELLLAVLTATSGRVEMRHFAGPRDPGTLIQLSPREREQLAAALAAPGFHPISRDDAPDGQLVFKFMRPPRKKRRAA